MGDYDPILVIDDDTEVAVTLSRTLAELGHRVLEANTGAEGLEAVRQNAVSLVLVDLRLPDMDGVEVMRQIQQRADPPEIIIITGYATLDSAIEAVEAGTSGYLVKPINPARLGAIVRRVLERRALVHDNARLFEQADRERRRLDVLYELARRLAAAPPGEVLTLLVNEASRLLDAEAAGIRLLEGDDLVLRARTEAAASVMLRERIKVGESLSGHIVATGEPLVLADLAADTRHDPAHKRGVIAQGFEGFLGVPVRLHGRVIGALNVFTTRRRPFLPEDVSLLTALGDQAALAIHKARLLDEAEEGRRLLERLYRVAVSMQESWSRDDRLRAFVHGLQQAAGLDRVNVFLATPEGELELVTRVGEDEAQPPARLPLAPAAGPFFQVIETRRALSVLHDDDLATLWPLDAAYRAYPFFRSTRFIVAPLVVGPRVIGVAVADNKRTRRPIPPASIEPFALLCQQLATALEEARLHAESQTREQRATKLYEVTRHLASSLDVEWLLEQITARARELLGSDAAAIYTWDEARGGLCFRHAFNLPHSRRGLVLKPGEGVAGRAFQERQPVWSRDRLADPALSYGARANQIISADAPRGLLAVPVVSRGDVLGVLVGHFFTPHDFADSEIQLLSTLADQAAIALEHARHYEEVRAQQTQLTQILDSTSDGIVLVSRDGRVQAANRRAGELLGFDSSEVLGRELRDLIAGHRGPDADHDRSFAALRAVIDEPDREAQGDVGVASLGRILHWVSRPTTISGGPDSVSARLASGSGWPNASGLPQGASGTTIGFTLTFQDVTHEREVSQMKSDFVSFVTHQLRTPLSGIKWMLELAAQQPELAAEASSYIQDARDAAQRLIELVNDLLDVSRLEHGRLALPTQEVNLGEMTRSVLDETAVLVHEKGHRLSVVGDTDVPPVTTDSQLLRQVVLNLVSNAIKYTPAGGAIAIRMSRDGDEVCWSITDSGIGVPKQAQARLFEKFFRADNVATVETEGTGLGLYLVRLIMERCGGRVWCESDPGEGATFRFRLPLRGV